MDIDCMLSSPEGKIFHLCLHEPEDSLLVKSGVIIGRWDYFDPLIMYPCAPTVKNSRFKLGFTFEYIPEGEHATKLRKWLFFGKNGKGIHLIKNDSVMCLFSFTCGTADDVDDFYQQHGPFVAVSLDVQTLEVLEMVRFEDTVQILCSQERFTRCPVCLENVREGLRSSVLLPCSHLIHRGCFPPSKFWEYDLIEVENVDAGGTEVGRYKRSLKCPLCRAPYDVSAPEFQLSYEKMVRDTESAFGLT